MGEAVPDPSVLHRGRIRCRRLLGADPHDPVLGLADHLVADLLPFRLLAVDEGHQVGQFAQPGAALLLDLLLTLLHLRVVDPLLVGSDLDLLGAFLGADPGDLDGEVVDEFRVGGGRDLVVALQRDPLVRQQFPDGGRGGGHLAGVLRAVEERDELGGLQVDRHPVEGDALVPVDGEFGVVGGHAEFVEGVVQGQRVGPDLALLAVHSEGEQSAALEDHLASVDDGRLRRGGECVLFAGLEARGGQDAGHGRCEGADDPLFVVHRERDGLVHRDRGTGTTDQDGQDSDDHRAQKRAFVHLSSSLRASGQGRLKVFLGSLRFVPQPRRVAVGHARTTTGPVVPRRGGAPSARPPRVSREAGRSVTPGRRAPRTSAEPPRCPHPGLRSRDRNGIRRGGQEINLGCARDHPEIHSFALVDVGSVTDFNPKIRSAVRFAAAATASSVTPRSRASSRTV